MAASWIGPVTLYVALGASDLASTRFALNRARPGAYESNRLGPVAGPMVLPALLAGSDLWLQSHGRKGWAKGIRIGGAVAIGAFVVKNLTRKP